MTRVKAPCSVRAPGRRYVPYSQEDRMNDEGPMERLAALLRAWDAALAGGDPAALERVSEEIEALTHQEAFLEAARRRRMSDAA